MLARSGSRRPAGRERLGRWRHCWQWRQVHVGSVGKGKPGSRAEGRHTWRIAEVGGEAESAGDSQSWDSKGTASALVVSVTDKPVSASSCSFHVYKMWLVTATQGSDAPMFTSRLETPWMRRLCLSILTPPLKHLFSLHFLKANC